MRTIQQRKQKLNKPKAEKFTHKRCTYPDHEGDRLLPISEFYQPRQSYCKKCMTKQKQKKRKEQRLARIKSTYAQYPYIVENAELFSHSHRLFKSGLIAEAYVFYTIVHAGKGYASYYLTHDCDVPFEPPIVEYYEDRDAVKNHWFINGRDIIDLCKFLIHPSESYDMTVIWVYGDVKPDHLAFASEASMKFDFQLGLINEDNLNFGTTVQVSSDDENA